MTFPRSIFICSAFKSVNTKYLLTVLTLLLTSITALATCTATERNADYGSPNGSSNSATVAAKINGVGDLVAITAWCYPGCTPVSVTVGSQTATKTTVSGVVDSNTPGTGQGFLFYVLSAAGSGTQTVTWTVSGSHSDIQVTYIDFSVTPGCVFTHHVDSPLGSCLIFGTCNGIVNAPSITPSEGDLLFNFTYSNEHVENINSPWSCPLYTGNGQTGTCQTGPTENVAAYILSAKSGSTANNTTTIHPDDTWQALLTSFSMSSSNPPPNPPTGLAALVQ